MVQSKMMKQPSKLEEEEEEQEEEKQEEQEEKEQEQEEKPPPAVGFSNNANETRYFSERFDNKRTEMIIPTRRHVTLSVIIKRVFKANVIARECDNYKTKRVLDNLKMPKLEEIFTTVAIVCHCYDRLAVFKMFTRLFCLEIVDALIVFLR